MPSIRRTKIIYFTR